MKFFTPSESQKQLIISTIKPGKLPDVLEKAIFIQELDFPRESLADLRNQGAKYLISFSNYQAYSVLSAATEVEQIVVMVDFPGDLGVFQFKNISRRNPEIDFEDIQEDEPSIPAAVPEKKRRISYDARKSPPPTEFFEQKLALYGNWQLGWWREVLQNSVDACLDSFEATGRKGEIKCQVQTWEEDNRVVVTVADNGTGMNETVLKKAFLQLGGSSKREGGSRSAGGLGKAKEVLFHAFPEWSVWTQKEGHEGIFFKAKHDPGFFDIGFRHCKEDCPVGCPKENQLELIEGRFIDILDRKKDVKIPQDYPPEIKDYVSYAREMISTSEVSGTTISVTMKKDLCVTFEELQDFISKSDFNKNLRVSYRRIHTKGGVDGSLEDNGTWAAGTSRWKTLEADNAITIEKPTIILTRPDGPMIPTEDDPEPTPFEGGSVWAEIYSMPKARKFRKTVIVRINGLYLFPAMGSYDKIPGKVIIELKYKPKGMKWDGKNKTWVPLVRSDSHLFNPDGTQKINTYGPSELMQENRNDVANQPEYVLGGLTGRARDVDGSLKMVLYNKQQQLAAFLDGLKTDPSKALVPQREPRIYETVNKSAKKLDVEEVISRIRSKELLRSPEAGVASLQKAKEDVLLGSFIELAEGGDLTSPAKVNANFGDGSLQQIKVILDSPEKAQAVLGQCDPSKIEIIKQAMETVKVTPLVSIDTSAQEMLWTGILQKLRKRNVLNLNSDSLAKMLAWEPNFILYDVTDAPAPPVPSKFNPASFGPKEKRVAKYWVEACRLCYIILGYADSGLKVGWWMSNPPTDVEAFQEEYLGMYMQRPHSKIGPFRAVLINPAMVKMPSDKCKKCKRVNEEGATECVYCGESLQDILKQKQKGFWPDLQEIKNKFEDDYRDHPEIVDILTRAEKEAYQCGACEEGIGCNSSQMYNVCHGWVEKAAEKEWERLCSKAEWIARYDHLSKEEELSNFTSIALHEVMHAYRAQSYGGSGHDDLYSYILTEDALTMAFSHNDLFRDIRDFYAGKAYTKKDSQYEEYRKLIEPYRIRGSEGGPDEDFLPGRGFYLINVPGKRGRKQTMPTLAAARQYIADNFPNQRCEIELAYWPTSKADQARDSAKIDLMGRYPRPPRLLFGPRNTVDRKTYERITGRIIGEEDPSVEDQLSTVRNWWSEVDHYADLLEKSEDDIAKIKPGEDVWRRNPRKGKIMNKKMALKILQAKRKRGRPSLGISLKLAQARKILGKVKKSKAVVKPKKAKKKSYKAGDSVKKPVGGTVVSGKFDVWVYWPASLGEAQVKKIMKATKVRGAQWYGDGCGMGECDVSFEVTGSANAKKLAKQVKSLKIRGVKVKVKPWMDYD